MDDDGYQGSNTVIKSFLLNWRRALASVYFRSAGSYLGGKLAVFTLAGLATQYLLTHFLAKEDYGLLVWVGTIIALLSFFGLPGITTSVTGAVARGYDGNFNRGTWYEIAGGTLGGLVLLGIAGYYWFWPQEETKALIFVVAGVLGPGLWLSTHQSYWNGKKNFKALFLWAVPVRLLQLFATATVLLYFSSNPLWVFGVQTVILVAANIGTAIGIMKIGGLNNKTSKEYQSYGWFLNYLSFFGAITSQIDKVIVGLFFGLEKLAIFAVGELIYRYFFKIPKSFLDQVFVPRLAEMRLIDASKWVQRRQPYLILSMFILLLLIAFALPTGYGILFSAKYTESIFYANLFLINIFVSTPGFLVGAIFRSHALKKESAVGQSIISLTPLLLIPMFAYLWGLKGVVFARIAQNVILSCYFQLFLMKKSKLAYVER